MLSRTHRRGACSGFSLIELVVALVILGIVAVAAGPSFQVFLLNTRIRNVAESLQNGMRLAQVEATKRNAQVDFVMTTASEFSANPNNGAPTASASGTAWVVRVPASTFVAGKVSAEGSSSVSITASVPGLRRVRRQHRLRRSRPHHAALRAHAGGQRQQQHRFGQASAERAGFAGRQGADV